MVFCWGQKMLNSPIGCLLCSLVLGCKVLHIFLRFHRFTNFSKILLLHLFYYQSDINHEYYVWWRIFLRFTSALLSFNGITHPYFVKWSTIVKIYYRNFSGDSLGQVEAKINLVFSLFSLSKSKFPFS